MLNYTFSLATLEDDANLRRLLARNAMPGDITVTFEREPGYFLGCGTMGRFWQVAIAREEQSGNIAGILCRAAHPHFVNGQSEELGYIGQLRVDHRYRGTWLLSQGLAFVHELHQDGRVRAYFAAISDENRVARGVLVEHPRPGFPALRELAAIVTLGIILRKSLSPFRVPRAAKLNLVIRRGSPEQLPAIVAFLQREGARKQLFPVYTEADFTTRDTTLGFSVEDFIVACRGDTIVGVVGLWDQSGYKQSVVQGYAPGLRRIRPFYNVGAKLVGAQPLPAVGEHIHSAYASFICMQDNDPALFRPLLKAVCDLAAARGYAYLMLGLADQDPLLPVALAYPHITYHSRLYTVAWDDAADFHAQLDGRIPYIEIAAL
ncbi:MAG TPA: hypothetical protein PKH77_03975 [Anaerolineae bacterium]|nr:hypothetical protein [Anaerolineae bacterium]